MGRKKSPLSGWGMGFCGSDDHSGQVRRSTAASSCLFAFLLNCRATRQVARRKKGLRSLGMEGKEGRGSSRRSCRAFSWEIIVFPKDSLATKGGRKTFTPFTNAGTSSDEAFTPSCTLEILARNELAFSNFFFS